MPSKSMRLHFKGEKPEKRRKKKKKRSSTYKGDYDDGNRLYSDVEDVGGDEAAWVDVRSPEDIAGPTLIYQVYAPSSSLAHSSPKAQSKCFALCLNHHLSRMEPVDVTPSAGLSPLASKSKEQAELLEGATIVEADEPPGEGATTTSRVRPLEIHQVFVASRVLDTRDPPRYTFRTTQHRFIGADKHGAVLCSAEARGPQEEWAVEGSSAEGTDAIAFRNHVHDTYLSLDEVTEGKLVLRADATTIGEGEAWRAKVQWKFRHQARLAQKERQIGQAGTGRLRTVTSTSSRLDKASLNAQQLLSRDSQVDRKALKRALKEGKAAEEMLDRRVKMKSDKFA